jgi:hypothetical protein
VTKPLYTWTRDLHLYVGLFISPFLLVFAVSVLFLNHAKVNSNEWTSVETVPSVQIPPGIETAQGPAGIAAAKAVLAQVHLDGEIGFTRFSRSSRHFIFPVSKPGLEANVDLDVAAGTATVKRRRTGLMEAMAYLHKMPGPHNVNIRGNWIETRAWGVFADLTIYLTLFITISGLYIWWALRTERRIGLAMLAAGVLTFAGLLNALLH